MPSVRIDSRVKLHPDFATGPAAALAVREALGPVEPENPVAAPIHLRAGERRQKENSVKTECFFLIIQSERSRQIQAHLDDESVFTGIMKEEMESLTPLRRRRAITHL